MGAWRIAMLAALGVAAACGRSGFNSREDAHRDGVAGDGSAATPNVAFVTSSTQVPTTFGSNLAGADAVCTARAAAAGLSGNFIALLSTSTVSARNRLMGSRGWVRTDGNPILDLPDDIESGKMYYPVALDENGVSINGQVVATGTNTGGDVSGNNCADYGNGGLTVQLGASDWTSFGWLDIGNSSPCTTAQRIYCFEIGKNTPLVVTPTPGRWAFVSAELYAVKSGGSYMDADAICNAEAKSANLSTAMGTGSYIALLATSTFGAISRVNATGATWVRLDGIPITKTAPAFASGSNYDTTINVTSTMQYIGGAVLTGILSIGQPNGASYTCTDWSLPTGTAEYGAVEDSSFLYDGAGAGACNAAPVYCLEQ